MRSTTPSPNEHGFTLVEVLVALAVAGGALILVLSANNTAFRQSVQSRERTSLERAAEAKLEECLLGTEMGLEGGLPGFPGLRWSVRSRPARIAALKRLNEIAFTVSRADGAVELEWTKLNYAR